jgi:hypothetical protein
VGSQSCFRYPRWDNPVGAELVAPHRCGDRRRFALAAAPGAIGNGRCQRPPPTLGRVNVVSMRPSGPTTNSPPHRRGRRGQTRPAASCSTRSDRNGQRASTVLTCTRPFYSSNPPTCLPGSESSGQSTIVEPRKLVETGAASMEILAYASTCFAQIRAQQRC